MLTESLLQPEFTEGFAIFIVGILVMILYAGMRLYSTIVVASWAITVMIFFGVAIYNLPIMMFYFGVISSCLLIALAGIRYSQVS